MQEYVHVYVGIGTSAYTCTQNDFLTYWRFVVFSFEKILKLEEQATTLFLFL